MDLPTHDPQGRPTVRFTAYLNYRIFERDDFSIWAVDVDGEALRAPDGSELESLVILGSGIEAPGEELAVDIAGVWEQRRGHDEYQVRVWYAQPHLPTNLDGIAAFLESRYISGVGPALARRIVAAFGEDTWRVLDESPGRLREVPGIGAKTAARILSSYHKNIQLRDIIAELAPYGIGASLAVRIARALPDAREIVRHNPWRLCGEGVGVGFHTADRIAEHNGIDPLSPGRIEAGFDYVMQQAEPDGHCYLTGRQLLDGARDLFEKSRPTPGVIERLPAQLERLIASGRYIREQRLGEMEGATAPQGGEIEAELSTAWVEAFESSADEGQGEAQIPAVPSDETLEQPVYTRLFWQLERRAARRLWTLMQGHVRGGEASGAGAAATATPRLDAEADARRLTAEAQVDRVAERLGFRPAAAQREAAVRFLLEPILILTGFPGSGKTTTLRLILECLDLPWDDVLLCAPTGRAARRMAEQTGRRASTIHTALQLDPESGEMPDDALGYAVVIVDEASMIDIRLIGQLLGRLADGTRLLLCGDPWQLPSVGPGNVLNDLIRSEVLPVVQLTEVFRQRAGSEIALNAARIRAGQTDLVYGRDFAFKTAHEPEEAAGWIEQLYLRAVEYTGDEEAVVCLTPFRTRTAAGSAALNQRLRECLNPARDGQAAIQHGERSFRQGDRVMLTRNQRLPRYVPGDEESEAEGQVSNGDTGRILAILVEDGEASSAVVRFNGEDYRLDPSHFADMDWAYACTIHKSQGSEYRFVIATFLRSHHIMLRRNLIYTALTRAKQNLIIVGDKGAVNHAIRTLDAARRQTGLAERLRQLAGIAAPLAEGGEALHYPEVEDEGIALGEAEAKPQPAPVPTAEAPPEPPPPRFGTDIEADLASIAHIRL